MNQNPRDPSQPTQEPPPEAQAQPAQPQTQTYAQNERCRIGGLWTKVDANGRERMSGKVEQDLVIKAGSWFTVWGNDYYEEGSNRPVANLQLDGAPGSTVGGLSPAAAEQSRKGQQHGGQASPAPAGNAFSRMASPGSQPAPGTAPSPNPAGMQGNPATAAPAAAPDPDEAASDDVPF